MTDDPHKDQGWFNEPEVATCSNCGWDRFSEIRIRDAIRIVSESQVRHHDIKPYADRNAITYVYRCAKCGKNL